MAESVRGEIEHRGGEFEAAFNRGDIAALAALYTEDATLMPPDSQTITGRQEIKTFWEGVRASGITRVALHPQQIEGSGDFATEVSTADLTAGSADGQTSTILVKYLVVWKRQPTGTWQLAVDIWNSRPTE